MCSGQLQAAAHPLPYATVRTWFSLTLTCFNYWCVVRITPWQRAHLLPACISGANPALSNLRNLVGSALNPCLLLQPLTSPHSYLLLAGP